jgi:hypothetical protein
MAAKNKLIRIRNSEFETNMPIIICLIVKQGKKMDAKWMQKKCKFKDVKIPQYKNENKNY